MDNRSFPRYLSSPKSPEKFWLEDGKILLDFTDLFPRPGMSLVQRLNAASRIVIVVTLVMIIGRFPSWGLFLLLALGVIVVIWLISVYWPGSTHREYLRPPRRILARKPIVEKLPNNFLRPKEVFRLTPRE